jgi:hypothetical protein
MDEKGFLLGLLIKVKRVFTKTIFELEKVKNII